MLKLSHLTIRHTKDLRDLVRDLSLTIHEGKKLPLLAKKEMENLPCFRSLCPQNPYQII